MVAKKQNPQSIVCCDIDQCDVVSAVESLYADEIHPISRILRKRLVEHMDCDGRQRLHVDLEHLQTLCVASSSLRVESLPGGDWAALLRGRQPHFVDPTSPDDTYPVHLWEGFQAFCDSATVDAFGLPGGRYACARMLKDCGLPFFDGQSLGKVCHVVEQALSKNRRVLGYLNGAIVPYRYSQSMIKEQCSKTQKPCSRVVDPAASMPVADWETTMTLLRILLQGARDGQLPLPNVKRLFKSQFQVQLSETALGYSKASDLFYDERFRHICTVHVRKQGYVLARIDHVTNTSTTTGPVAALGPTCDLQSVEGGHACLGELLPIQVKNTFIHAELPASTPLAGLARRAYSASCLCSSGDSIGSSCDSLDESSTMTDSASCSLPPLPAVEDEAFIQEVVAFDPTPSFDCDEISPCFRCKPVTCLHNTADLRLAGSRHEDEAMSKECLVVRNTFLSVPVATINVTRRSRSVPK